MKKFTAILLAFMVILPIMSLSVSGAQQSVFNTTPNADGIYARYTFSEVVDGKIVDDINGNNGTLMNGATIANDTDRGSVLALDGTDQYVHLPNAITKGVKTFTIAAWYKWTEPDDRSWSRVWDIGIDTNDNFFMTPRSGSNTIRFATKLSEWGTAEDVFDGPEPIVNEWVHVAAVMGNGKTAFYLNGELVDEYGVDHTPDGLGDSDQNFLGKAQYPDPYFMGYIDDVTLYNKALSAADIKNLMNADNSNVAAAATTAPETAAPAAVDTPAQAETAAPEVEATTVVAPAAVAPTPAPQTGDTTILLVAVCAVAAIAGVVFLRVRKARAR